MAIEEKEEQTTSLKDLIELVEKDPIPTNVFTIEDKDPMVILGKLNEVIAYLKNLQATINSSDTKANQALESALLALTNARDSITASTNALNSANKALETANLAIDTANTSLEGSNQAKTASNEALRLSNLANENANSAKETADSAKERAETANVLSANALDTAGEANTKADNAIESADSALSTANEANTKAENANQTASTANEIASNANQTASTANEIATNAQSIANNALQIAQDALNQVVGSLGSKVYDNNGNLKSSVKFAGHNGINVDLAEDNETFDIRLDEDITKAIEDTHKQAQANAEDIVNITDMLAGVEEKVETEIPNRLSNVENNLSEINPKVARALLTPMSSPSELKLVGIDTSNNQEMLNVGSGLKVENGTLKASLTLNEIYPIGSIYMSTSPTNPQDLFGGTWVAFGQGRTIIGAGTSDQTFTAGTTGGASTHTLTINEMPSHTHTQNSHAHKFNRGNRHEYSSNVINGYAGDGPRYLGFVEQSGGGGDNYQYTTGRGQYVANPEVATNQNTGGGASHNNLPPYIVTYMWTRTA